jgi:hypothetical protein
MANFGHGHPKLFIPLPGRNHIVCEFAAFLRHAKVLSLSRTRAVPFSMSLEQASLFAPAQKFIPRRPEERAFICGIQERESYLGSFPGGVRNLVFSDSC